MSMKNLKSIFVFIFLTAIVFTAYAFSDDGYREFFIPHDPPKAHYVIEIELDSSRGFLLGSETITFRNTSKKQMEFIAINWNQKNENTIRITGGDRLLKPVYPNINNETNAPLIYEVGRPINPGKEITIDVEFKFNIGSLGDQVHIAGTWHPRLWRRGIPVPDSYEVKFAPPDGYTMAVSGKQNEKTGYYENPRVTTSFGIYLAKNVKATVQESAGVVITALYSDKGESCARLCLDTAADIISFYKEWHGFYPFDFLYIIPGASRPMGGYPFASGIIVIHGQQKFEEMPLLHWKWITAHEIGHQYWGEYVMSGDSGSMFSSWLMIGLGIMADKAYVVSRGLGLQKHENFMKTYLTGVKKYYDTTVDASPSLLKKQNFDRNNIIIHGKGFSILNALECIIGSKEFEKIYMKSLKSFGGKRLSYREFQKICERTSGENLDWFFKPWVRSPKYLFYEIKSRRSEKCGDEFVSTVVVEAGFESILMPVPVKAEFEDGTSEIKWTNNFIRKSMLRFKSRSPLKSVILDPENKLAMLDAPLAIIPEELPEKIAKLPWTGAGERALEIFRIAKDSKMDMVNNWFKLGMVLFESGLYDPAFESFQNITQLKPDKRNYFMALVWMGNVKDVSGNREEAVKFYKESLKYDTGISMRHDQFGIVTNRGWVEKRLKNPYNWEK